MHQGRVQPFRACRTLTLSERLQTGSRALLIHHCQLPPPPPPSSVGVRTRDLEPTSRGPEAQLPSSTGRLLPERVLGWPLPQRVLEGAKPPVMC